MSKRGGKRVVIRARVPKATAETLRAIAEAQGMTLARLIEMAVQTVIEVAKKPNQSEEQSC